MKKNLKSNKKNNANDNHLDSNHPNSFAFDKKSINSIEEISKFSQF